MSPFPRLKWGRPPTRSRFTTPFLDHCNTCNTFNTLTRKQTATVFARSLREYIAALFLRRSSQ